MSGVDWLTGVGLRPALIAKPQGQVQTMIEEAYQRLLTGQRNGALQVASAPGYLAVWLRVDQATVCPSTACPPAKS